MILNSPIISGSLTVTGNISSLGSIAMSGSQVISGSLTVVTGSGIELQVTNTGVRIGNVITDSHNVTGSLNVSGSITTTGTITAQTLVVQTVSSSVIYSSGSNIFGNNIANTQVLTGSVTVTGSLAVVTNGTEFQVTSTGVNLGNALTDSHVISGSLRVNPNGLFVSSSGLVGIGTVSPSQLLEVVGGEIKAGRVDSSLEGGQVSFGRSTDNATAWYIDAYGNAASPQLRFINVVDPAITMTLTGSRVGIGTSSPSGLLQLNGSLSTSGDAATLTIKQSSTTYTNGIYLERGGERNGYYMYIGGSVDSLTFRRNYFGTQSDVMSLTRDGYVGIGTTAPSARLTIIRDSPFNTGDQGLRIKANDGDGYNLWMGVSTSGYATIQSYQDNVGGRSLLLNPLNGGDVLIGTTTSAGRLTVTQSTNSPALQLNSPNGISVPIAQFSSVTSASTSWYALVTQSGNGSSITTNTLFIYGNGNVANINGSYGTLSDISLKENIVDATSKLSDILQLKVRNFNLKADENKIKQIGFIAQELEEVFPSMVEIDGGSGMKTIKTSVLLPMLVKAIQELKAQNDDLQSQINELKAQ